MLYLIYGTDTKKARSKARGLLDSLISKKPDSVVLRLSSENINKGVLEEGIQGRGLFSEKYVVFLDTISDGENFDELVIDKAKEFALSENIFILLEAGLTKKIVSKFEKHVDKMLEFSLPKVKKEEFNIFSLTDAFGARDRKKLWVLLQKALRAGSSSEEIHGILFWQIKNILLVKGGGTPTSLGLNPFVLKKAQGFAQKFSDKEAHDTSKDLIHLYHRARRGEATM
ncbi:MAG TPA: hypothetical protein ENI66_00245, partial [Candidatus Yonathbacteria bacterium]|nr:hypothetical protein [Candidatus Yonathbacteria bacterium]